MTNDNEIYSYYERPEISNSDIGSFLYGGPTYFRSKKEQEIRSTKAFDFGRLLHCYVLQPEKFKQEYVIADVSKIEGLMGKFIEYMAKLTCSSLGQSSLSQETDYQLAYNLSGFKYPIKRVVEDFKKPENEAYYNFLVNNYGKIFVDPSEFKKIEGMAEALKSHKKASSLLGTAKNKIGDVCVNELEIYWEKSVETDTENEEEIFIGCKSMVDRLVIDSVKKIAYIIDIKTTSKPVKTFKTAYKNYSYYRQLSFYKDAVKWYLQHKKKEDLKDWKFYCYIVAVETSPPYCVKVFQPVQMDLEYGANIYKGVLKELYWHLKTNIWIDREEHEGTGVENITIFDEITKDDINTNKEEDDGEDGNEGEIL